MNARIALLVALITTTYSAFAQLTSSFDGQQPCWMESPVTNKNIGQVGIARNLWIGGPKPEELSLSRAINALCHLRGRDCDAELLASAIESKSLFGANLHFNHFTKNGYLYSYAGYSPANEAMCEPLTCSIAQCEPAWLCNPSITGDSAVLGISYRAMNPAQQARLSIKNGLYQAEYLYGVKIKARNTLVQGQISNHQFSLQKQEGNVDAGDRETWSYYVKQQCQAEDTLYSQILLVGVEKLVQDTVMDLAWLKNPKANGLDGAVGSAEKPAANGLISKQIEIAIKRAAITLAFEKYAAVNTKDIIVTHNKNGTISIRNVSEETDVELKAGVKQIHFEDTPGPFLKVYVWLVKS